MPLTDATNDATRRSWVDGADSSDFPIQNLPYGVMTRDADDEPRIAVRIGDRVLDVRTAIEVGLLGSLPPETACALCAGTLNGFMAQGRTSWSAARAAIADLLDAETATLRDDAGLQAQVMHDVGRVTMHMPATIGDYTDFYASVHHATNIGSLFRPDNPLLPNYKHLPVGYHGRASSIVLSGTDIRRPNGQTRPDDAAPPVFGPSRLLDYELEMGFFTGPGNTMGDRITMEAAGDNLFGMCIVNDWSARDVQKWEYQPLGPFNAKNFATTISPWVVTLDALAPYRIPGPPRGADDPAIIDYLVPTEDHGLDIMVEVHLSSQQMREQDMAPIQLSRGNFQHMFWTIAQMLTHHSSTGCNIRPGDMMASGTISGPEENARGCLLELTWRGTNPIDLPDGTQRKFLQDGDEVIMTAWCEGDGKPRIGFGTCVGRVTPAAS